MATDLEDTDRAARDVQRHAIWFVVRKLDGWYVLDLNTYKELAGPYSAHAYAVEAADVRAHRVALGWKP